MFSDGIVEEVKRLNSKKLGLTAQKALGIKDITAYLKNDTALWRCKENLKQNTRNYAKRQLTWFRADTRIKWIKADVAVDVIVNKINEMIRRKILL